MLEDRLRHLFYKNTCVNHRRCSHGICRAQYRRLTQIKQIEILKYFCTIVYNLLLRDCHYVFSKINFRRNLTRPNLFQNFRRQNSRTRPIRCRKHDPCSNIIANAPTFAGSFQYFNILTAAVVGTLCDDQSTLRVTTAAEVADYRLYIAYSCVENRRHKQKSTGGCSLCT